MPGPSYHGRTHRRSGTDPIGNETRWGDVGNDCGPTTFGFADDFDRADGPIGADWTRGATTTANWTIVSDQCQFDGGSVEDILFLPAGDLSDEAVEVMIPAFPRTHQASIGPGARLQNTIDAIGNAAGYYVVANQQDTPSVHNSLEIWKRETNNSFDQLVSFATPVAPVFADGDRIGIRVTGTESATTIEALVNGVVIGSVIDDGVTYGASFETGFVGLHANTNSSTPKVVFDDFKAGTDGGFFDYIKFGDGLKVTDEGNDTIRVDACVGEAGFTPRVEVIEGNDFSAVDAAIDTTGSTDYLTWFDSATLTGYPDPLIGVDPDDERVIFIPTGTAGAVYRIEMEVDGLSIDPRATFDPTTDSLQYVLINVRHSAGDPGAWDDSFPFPLISGSNVRYPGYKSSDNIASLIDTATFPLSASGNQRRWVSFVWNIGAHVGDHVALSFEIYQPLFGDTDLWQSSTHQTIAIERLKEPPS